MVHCERGLPQHLADSRNVFKQLGVVDVIHQRQVNLPRQHEVVNLIDKLQQLTKGHLGRVKRDVNV